jgi:CDP-diacylglycerol--glycerol-3-phosphate 3-phosphatidyltransferase
LFIALKFHKEGSIWVLGLMYAGFVSDIFDGIIARKLKVSTEKLRRADSQVDLLFWISIGAGSWIIFPELFSQNWKWILLLFILEGLIYFISFIRFKKEISTHSYLSKLWGITLLLAFHFILGFGEMGFFFFLCVVVGAVSQLDVILILFILPKWNHDIPSSYHAYLIRKNKPFKKWKLFNS